MNLGSIHADKTYCYLTRDDFTKAFDEDETMVVATDYMVVNVNIENSKGDETAFQLRNHKDPKTLNLQIIGGVTKPVQMKLVNSSKSCENNLMFDIDDLSNKSCKAEEDPLPVTISVTKKARKSSPAHRINLFRRAMKTRKYTELSSEERENMAKIVLDKDKSKDKSLFHIINKMQLLSPSDYSEPDFIQLDQPIDSEYTDNYSESAPSVHDLFDIDLESIHLDIAAHCDEGSESEFYVTEYLDEDVDM